MYLSTQIPIKFFFLINNHLDVDYIFIQHKLQKHQTNFFFDFIYYLYVCIHVIEKVSSFTSPGILGQKKAKSPGDHARGSGLTGTNNLSRKVEMQGHTHRVKTLTIFYSLLIMYKDVSCTLDGDLLNSMLLV